MKICLAASAGGHLTQLLRLTPACERHDAFIVTTGKETSQKDTQGIRTYVVQWANRKHPFLGAKMALDCHRIIRRERPQVLISTGAAVGCILSLFMKAHRKKVLWIDTISHTEYLTMSGRIVRVFADQFLVQWPELAEKYPNSKYVGSLL